MISKVLLYLCFVPAVLYGWSVFANTYKTFLSVFHKDIEARKESLNEVIKRYNQNQFQSQ